MQLTEKHSIFVKIKQKIDRLLERLEKLASELQRYRRPVECLL